MRVLELGILKFDVPHLQEKERGVQFMNET